jgi:OOP family OmpA-OmpF porin
MDSDRDGVTDDKDECPNTPLGASVDHRGCWVLRDIYFDTGRSELKVGTLSTLDEVAQVMSKNSNLRVDIQGHTDHVGTDRYNQRLSEKRAEAVRTYLIREKGIDETRLTASGFGKTKPIADNGTPEGRAMNRRVELTPTP